jgi:hypothetical protein
LLAFRTRPHAPASELNTIPLAWPFVQWGLDQVGPLPKSSCGGHTYLLVAVDKFSKWIEAVPVTNQEATTTVKFFESITCRYGVPNSIIIDNGSNFASGEFQEFDKKARDLDQLCFGGAPPDQRPSQESKQARLRRPEEMTPLTTQRRSRCMARRITIGAMESIHDTQLLHRLCAILLVIRRRGCVTLRRLLLCPARHRVHRGRRDKGNQRRPRSARQGSRHRSCPCCSLPTKPMELP